MSGLSRLQSRLLALLLTLLVFFACYALLVRPYASARQQAVERVEELQFQLLKYRQIGAGQEALEQRYRQLQQRSAVDRAFLNQASEALAVAALQQLVKQHVARSGGQLSRLQVNPSRAERSFRRVSINVKLRIGVDGLAKLLHGLSQGKPVLFVDQLLIRAVQTGSPRRGAAPNELDISFDLAGYQREGAA